MIWINFVEIDSGSDKDLESDYNWDRDRESVSVSFIDKNKEQCTNLVSRPPKTEFKWNIFSWHKQI